MIPDPSPDLFYLYFNDRRQLLGLELRYVQVSTLSVSMPISDTLATGDSFIFKQAFHTSVESIRYAAEGIYSEVGFSSRTLRAMSGLVVV